MGSTASPNSFAVYAPSSSADKKIRRVSGGKRKGERNAVRVDKYGASVRFVQTDAEALPFG